jgi:heat shock protein HslJ
MDEQPIPVVPSHPITITFDDDQVFGRAACNGFGGSYNLNGSEIAFVEFGMTEMACSPQEVMIAEQAFVNALFNVETVEVVDSELVLSGSRTELRFEPLEQIATPDLLGTVWVLDGLVQGEAVSSVNGERATLELFSDGSMIGSTGCRTLTGSYAIAGAEVAFTDLNANGDCPADLQTQDSSVLTVLEGGFSVEIDGNTLTLSISGDEGLIYRADAAASADDS